jgi:hypothetical protein
MVHISVAFAWYPDATVPIAEISFGRQATSMNAVVYRD